jgi:hypothetical protein
VLVRQKVFGCKQPKFAGSERLPAEMHELSFPTVALLTRIVWLPIFMG